MKIFNTLFSLSLVFLIVSSCLQAQSIYISELSFNPCTDQGNDSDCEYLVISNNDASAVDISGYSIGNGFSYTFPVGTTIPAGGSISLGISGTCPAGTFDLSGGWTGSMSNSNDETIEILDAGGALVSSVMYVGTIGDGDCMASCFDVAGTASACTSSVLTTPTFDCPAIMANIGDACTDSDGDASTIAADCTCTEVTPTFDCPAIMANIGDACTDSDGDNSTIAVDCTCTEVTPPPPADIYISELSFNPCTDQGNDGDCEYIVITNNGATAADISNYSISNGFGYTFPAGTTIPAGGSISLGISGNCAAGSFNLSGGWNGAMSNSNDETIEILDAYGNLVSSVMYDGTIGDGDCMASCFDASGTVSACPSSVLDTPTFDCPAIMANIGDACTDSDGDASTIAADCTCTEITPTFDCPAIMANIGDACDDGDATTVNDMINAACECAGTMIGGSCPASAKINEFHYDNGGTDVNEFVEIILTAGSDPSSVQVDLYNGSNGTVYDSVVLSSGDFVSSDGTFDYYVWNVVPQNGPDGIAVSCLDGTQYQFITYEGAFMATDGPFAGVMGTDVGVEETSATTDTQSIMCDGSGTYFTNCTADPGMANDLTTCVSDIPGCTDPNACNYNMDATVDDGSCFNVGDACDDGDPNTGGDVYVDCTTCMGSMNPVPGCTDPNACNYDAAATEDDGSCFSVGDTCDDGDANTTNDMYVDCSTCVGTGPVTCPASAKINEFHYDNGGTDANEFVEIILPAGSDPSSVQVDLYNGSNGTVYDSVVLSSADFVSSDGTFDYYVWNVVPQNGPDGIAVSCLDGTQYQFITYEGAFMATDGPFAGVMGTDVGVEETSATTDTQSIMCDGSGTYFTNCTADPGMANDLTTCVSDIPGCTDPNACNYNMDATVDDGSCFSVGDACDDGDPNTGGDVYVDCTTCMGSMNPVPGCTDPNACNYDAAATEDDGSCFSIGDVCDDGDPNTNSDVYTDCSTCMGVGPVNCPAYVKVNEFHYDNAGTDANEFIEIELPIGTDPSSIQIDLYNGSNGQSYDSYVLTNADLVGSSAYADYYVWYPAGIQNGPDGIAISCLDGTQYQFITYEGEFMATDGPFAGETGFDIFVSEDADNTETQSIMCDGTGIYLENCTADPGVENDLNTCVLEIAGCTDLNACNYDPDANVDDGTCFSVGDSCDDGDPTTGGDVWIDCTTCQGTLPDQGCTDPAACNYDPTVTIDDGSCFSVGDNCDDGNFSTIDDVYIDCNTCQGTPTGASCPNYVKVNEFHYDNAGTDANEFIEIELPIGTDPSSIQIDLYNGSNGQSYDSYVLTNADLVGSSAYADYYVWYPAGIQNGPDGIAISCLDGTQYQFITYEGEFMATDGPFAGETGFDIFVSEDADNTETQSIMCDGTGIYLENCTADPGVENNNNTCVLNVSGCTDPCADNYDPNADMDDGSCNPYDDTCNADCTAGSFGGTWDAASCSCINESTPVNGCTNQMATNYDAAANCDDGSCMFSNPGCTDPCADNFDPNADMDDGSCNPYDDTCNADCLAGPFGGTWDATSCSCINETAPVNGCTNQMATNYDAAANCDDGSCMFSNPGCTDPCADNFDPNADMDDGSCNPYDDTCNADCLAGPFGGTWDATSCSCVNETAPVNGCTDATATNYDAAANCDDGSCMFSTPGCTDPCADNFDPNADMDDGSCNPYDDTCNADCLAGPFGGTWDATSCSCVNETAPVNGCTDAMASNYNPAANCDDGSCITICEEEIVGSIVAADEGCDVSGLEVMVMGPDGTSVTVTTDVNGNFTVPGGPFPCGIYSATITDANVPACYSNTGTIGPIEFIVDGEGGGDDGPLFIANPDIPTLSQWGLMILALLLMTFGALKLGFQNVRLEKYFDKV